MSTIKNLYPVHLKYSYVWASKVVKDFLERYARGTDFVTRMSGISYKTLHNGMTKSLMSEDQFYWERWKRLIKTMSVEKYRDFMHMSREDRRKYLTFVKTEAGQYLIDQKKTLVK